MSREYCPNCARPNVTCICKLCCDINNQIDVWILQHPSETKQAKGSAILTNLSLQKSKILVGEDFSRHDELNALIADTSRKVYLLYPHKSANVVVPVNKSEQQRVVLLVLDGTWKKAYKMYQMSSNLQALPKVIISPDVVSQYVIRKHHKPNDVSTLEACAHALAVMENSQLKYQPLMNSFIAFNDFQLQLSQTKLKSN